MRKNRLSHADVAALLDGTAPSGRPDLASVAALVDDLRLNSFEAPPRPTAELASRLDVDRASWISPAAGGLLQTSDRGAAPVLAAPAPKRGKARMFFTWFTGLGLAAKIGIGAGAVAFGAVGAGAVNALPAPVQHGFNQVVSAVTAQTPIASGTVVPDPTVPVAPAVTVETPPVLDATPAAVPPVVAGEPAGNEQVGNVEDAAHDGQHGQVGAEGTDQNPDTSGDSAKNDGGHESTTAAKDASSTPAPDEGGSGSNGSGHRSGKND